MGVRCAVGSAGKGLRIGKWGSSEQGLVKIRVFYIVLYNKRDEIAFYYNNFLHYEG